jgi:hypothetical protein
MNMAERMVILSLRGVLKRSPTRLILLALALNFGSLLLVLLISDRTGIRPSAFYRDPNSIAGQSFAIGFMSNIGVVAWIVAASIALFAAAVRRSWGQEGRDTKALFLLGLVTFWMGLDDLFMLHDGLADSMGVPQTVFVLINAVLVLVWIASAARNPHYFSRGFLLLILAFAGLGSSLLIDFVNDNNLIGVLGAGLLEDVFKQIGITFWALYTIRLSLAQVQALNPLHTGIP